MNASIVITGFSENDLTYGAAQKLKLSENIILHTENCYISQWLKDRQVKYTSLDDLYREAGDFDVLLQQALKRLEGENNFTFCVMDSSDETAKALLAKHPHTDVCGGGAFAALEIRSTGKYTVLSAVDALKATVSPLGAVLIKEIDTRFLAGDVKLVLEEVYGEDAQVFFRVPEGGLAAMPLSAIDRLKRYDHRCACLVNPPEKPAVVDFDCLRLISEQKPVKDSCLNEETLAKELIHVVQSIQTAQDQALFTQRDIFERAADIITKGEST